MADTEAHEPKFTPGPWHNLDGDIYDNRSDDAAGIPLVRSERASYRSWGRELSDAERQANAALIAAAPEMFTALFNALALMDCIQADSANSASGSPALLIAMAEARGALSKAEGR